MSGVIYNFFRTLAAVFCSGLVIKLVDDFLDEDLDKLEGKTTISIIWHKAVLPYSLLIFSVAVLLDRELAISLFLASYLVGMSKDLKQRWLPGLNSWQEILILGILGCIVLPVWIFLGSVFLMLMVQLMDDLLDYSRDRYSFSKNLVFRLGQLETVILLFLTGVLAIIILPLETICVIISFPQIIYLLEVKGARLYD